jgi:hypothetical protein
MGRWEDESQGVKGEGGEGVSGGGERDSKGNSPDLNNCGSWLNNPFGQTRRTFPAGGHFPSTGRNNVFDNGIWFYKVVVPLQRRRYEGNFSFSSVKMMERNCSTRGNNFVSLISTW